MSQNEIEKYSSYGNIIIIADLNSRIGEKQEELTYVDDTGDDHNILQDIDVPIRKTLDVKSNSSGRKLLNMMNECSLLTLNGRKLGDTAGALLVTHTMEAAQLI